MSNFYVQAQNSDSMPKFYGLEKIAQVQGLGSILRLNVQAQYLSFFVLKKLLRLNVQPQCLGLMCLIYLVYGIL